jgi:hypothetical protein
MSARARSFLLTTRENRLDADATGISDQAATPALGTVQTLATFAGGTAWVTIPWQIAKALSKSSFVDQLWIPAALAIVWFIFVVTAPGQGDGFSNRLGAAMVASLNTAQIWAAAVGIDAIGTGDAGTG